MERTRSHLYYWLAIFMVVLAACQPITLETPVAEQGSSAKATATPSGEQAETVATGEPPDLSGAAAILVVDFYRYEVSEDRGNSENCFAATDGTTSEGAGQSGSTGVASGVVSTTVPHGDLVYEHIKQQFGSDAAFYNISPGGNEHGIGLVESVSTDDGTYVVAQVNIGNHFTDKVLEQIRETRAWLRAQGAAHFVVNMSVVVKPCDTMFDDDPAQYLQFVQCNPTLLAQRALLNPEAQPNEEDTIADPLLRLHAEVAASYYADPFAPEPQTRIGCQTDPTNEQAIEQLSSIARRSFSFYNNLIDDELVAAFHDLSYELPYENTVYVAASGNDGYPYPYAPALFPDVVSTGAIRGVSEPLGYEPNGAEWVWDDRFEWIVPDTATVKVFDNDPSTPEDVLPGKVVTLRGTSFATPKLSYLMARAMLEGVALVDCHEDVVYAAKNAPLPATWEEWRYMTGIVPEDIWLNYPATDLSGPSGVCTDFPDPVETIPPS